MLFGDLGLFVTIFFFFFGVRNGKVLVGCDGVNSVVAKWLGFKKASYIGSGRSAIRGCANFEDGHGFDPNFMQFSGHGVRFGTIPCDDGFAYWFFTFPPSPALGNFITQTPPYLF